MKYKKFIIENYRAIEKAVTIDIERDKIVPLIGANESGKTTILQAVYAFDYANDKEFEGRHLKNLRNFYNPKNKEDAQVSAVINIKKEEFLNCISNEQLRNKYSSIEDFTEIKKFCDGRKAQGGGDGAEDWAGGYDIALTKIKWRNKLCRLIP